MTSSWSEVQLVNDEKRCELVLSGPSVSKRIEEEGLDGNIFQLKGLNFLEISKTSMSDIPSDLGNLSNLTRIIFQYNQLQRIPSAIENLKKLKFLDLSYNKITEVTDAISLLTELQTINLSHNKISTLPSLANLINLVSLNISSNEFAEFPTSLCNSDLIHFTDLIANNNSINAIPPDINQLSALKVFNFGANALTEIPGQLADCTKLKELNLKDNKLKDKRLLKLIDQCHVKQVLEYVRMHCSITNSTDGSKQAKSKKKAKQNKKTVNDEIIQLLDQISVLHVQDETIKIISLPSVQDIRPYVVACVLKDVKFSTATSLKKFISLQTKLHESICEKRTAATIATHDLSKINGDLTYDAKDPKSFKIISLNRKKERTAAALYALLNEEADALRKEKKKNTYSGIHKYLYLLKEKTLYPCLSDSSNQVVSFPPITNSEITKVSEDTKDILVEVTGNSLSVVKKVMDTLLEEVVKLGIGELPNTEKDSDDCQCYLQIQQVKVVDLEGKLKVVYPSRTDIQTDKINVIRV